MDWAPPAGTTDSALKALEPKLLSGHIPSDRLVRAPDRSQADRSFARHEASEEPSQARTRRERHFHYECEEFVADLIAMERNRRQGFRAGLRVKRVQAASGLFEMTWAPDGRATFSMGEPVIAGKRHIVWHRVGDHSILP